MTDNSHQEERKKKCPFLGEWCIGDACALHSEITKEINGVTHKFKLCAFNSLGIMISEINAKTQRPVEKIKLPPLFRG